MRGTKAREPASPILAGALEIEIRKGARGATCAILGVIGISDLSDEQIVMLTHRGRITLRGSSLVLVIYDSGIVEVEGKIEGVELGYAKR